MHVSNSFFYFISSHQCIIMSCMYVHNLSPYFGLGIDGNASNLVRVGLNPNLNRLTCSILCSQLNPCRVYDSYSKPACLVTVVVR